MTYICSLDLGTQNIGWAYGSDDDRAPTTGTYCPPATGKDLGWLLADVRAWLTPFCRTRAFDLLVYESPVFVAQNNVMTVRKMFALGGLVELVAYDLKLPCEEKLPGPVRKHFLGRGNVPKRRPEIKAAVMRQCQILGWKPSNDDEGDAAALWSFTIAVKCSPLSQKIGALL